MYQQKIATAAEVRKTINLLNAPSAMQEKIDAFFPQKIRQLLITISDPKKACWMIVDDYKRLILCVIRRVNHESNHPSFGYIKSLEVVSQRIDTEGNIVFEVKSKDDHSTCHKCGKPATKQNGRAPIRRIRHLPIFDQPVYLMALMAKGTRSKPCPEGFIC